MTVTMLIVNTLRSAELAASREGLLSRPNLDLISWDPSVVVK